MYRSVCVQPGNDGTPGNTIGDEDCLYLNVFCQNAQNYTTLSAVIVFIDGNPQLSAGGLGQQEEKGIVSNLVQKGVIVVTIQYRLGPLGFYAAPSDLQITSNVGMLDQVKGLQWVNRNIASFGGDPQRVSLAGQAGGACAVAAHTYSPASQGLFQQAILQSGSLDSCYSADRNYNGVDPTAIAANNQLQYDQGLSYTPLNGNGPPAATTQQPMNQQQQNQNQAPITNPSELLANQLCNISPEQWRSGQLNGLKECLQNYTVDAFTKTDGIHTATWMIVRDNLFLNGSLGDLAARRPPIPLIIGTVQDEDADYAFKLVNAAAKNNGTEADAFNNWFVDFAKKNRLNGTAMENAKNIIATNYNVTLPRDPTQTTTPAMIYGPPQGSGNNQQNMNYPANTATSQPLMDDNGKINASAMFHTLAVVTNVSSDAGTVSQVVTEVDSWVQNGNRYVHVYRFEHRSKLGSTAATQMLKGYEPIQKGQDKLFLFMKEDVWTKQKPTTDDRAMADTMGQRWTDFAKQGSVDGWNTVQPFQPVQGQQQTPYCSLTNQPQMQTGYGNQARQVFNDQVYPLAQNRQYDASSNSLGNQINRQLQGNQPLQPQVHVWYWEITVSVPLGLC
ncbi:unnamed protein product, partial [Mesorhabditis spiculigera]